MMQCFSATASHPGVFVALAVLVGLAIMAWVIARQAPFSGKGFCFAAHLAMAGWMTAALLELWSQTEACKIFFSMAAWPFIALLPTVWAFFIHAYAFGRESRLARWEWAVLVGGPLAVTALALTNPWHGMFYGAETALTEIDGQSAVRYDHGPLFFVAAAYLYLFMAASIGVTLRGLWYASPAYRGHFIVLVAITSVPIAGNLAYILGGFTVFGFDPTPFMFAAVLVLFAWMISTIRPFDIATIGRDVVFFNARDPVVMVDTLGRTMAWNPAADELLSGRAGGFQRGWAVPETAAIGPLVRAVVDGEPGAQAKQLDIGGRRFAVRVLPVERPIARRRPVMGWMILLTDISDLLTLQDELSNERDYYALLLETDLSGVLAFDGEGQIVFANAEAGRLIGLSEGSAVGGRYDDASWQISTVDGVPLQADAVPIAMVLQSRQPVRDSRVTITRPDGVRRALSMNASYLDVPGMAVRVVCSIVDITDQLSAEIALREAVAVAEAANAAKSRFLANMSHEIRTPLNAVLGMAEVLEDAVQDPVQRRQVTTIRDSGALLLHLLNDLLDLAKIDTGKLTLESMPMVPLVVVQDTLALHAPRAAQKGLSLVLEGGRGAEVPRLGDPYRIAQILNNLLGNALKFTEKGGVSLLVEVTGDAVVLGVQDTGIGMTAQQLATLFRDFEQADTSTTRRFGGTGLGMAIVHHLVEQMGGEIDVTSVPGQGTNVRVSLPLALAPMGVAVPDVPVAPQPIARAAVPANPPLAGVRVLAADDIATNRLVLKAMLARLGAEVTLVEDGQQALLAYRPGAFDVLLLDISMPVLDGMETLDALLRTEALAGRVLPPALATTANVLPEQIAQYLRAGFSGHISKPMAGDDLLARISAALHAVVVTAPKKGNKKDPL